MNVLTFDVEEWFHILDNASTKTEKEWRVYESRLPENMSRILTLLAERGQKATFFCLGWIARRYPKVVREIAEYGFEIACHSDRHQLTYEQTPQELRIDLSSAAKTIEDVIGRKVRAYRAPGFSVTERNKWVFEILIENGIEIDCSVFPARRAHGGLPGFGTAQPAIIETPSGALKEFPINSVSFGGASLVFSGGGYFRVLPYWLIRRLMSCSPYVMTYFHPRDFDPDQPVIEELSVLRRFKSYYGLGGSLDKLRRLITDFEFIDLDTASRRIDWAGVSKVRL